MAFLLFPCCCFGFRFPKPLLHRRWAWMMPGSLSAPLLGSTATIDYILLFAPNRAAGTIPGWLGAVIAIDFLIVFLASVVILSANYFSLGDVTERRRIRLVVFGLPPFFVDFFAFLLFSLSRKTFWIAGIAISPLMFGAGAASVHHLRGLRGS